MNFGSQSERGNVGIAVLAGLVVAIACALLWGVIAYSTKYQLSIMAILVGLAVGTVMARIGRVKTPAFAIVSAALAVFGCALGSLVAEILVLNRHGVPLSDILAHLNVVFRFYPQAVGGLGFLFWVFAALYGYRIGMGNSMRWGWSRRMRPPRQPYGAVNQPYGTMNQPYGMPSQPNAPGQEPYIMPQQPYGAPGQSPGMPDAPGQSPGGAAYGTPAPGGTVQPGAPGQADPDFGFKQPPSGFGSPPP